MIIVDIISWAILLYLAYFIIYNVVVIFKSSRGRLFDIEKKDYMLNFQQNLTVIIYSHNNSSKVKELIEAFNKQDYDRSKYSLNILLDNCDEENIKFLEILGNAKLWRINTDVKPIGKYKSLSWIFERILACENTNAFVYLSADSKVKTDFLQKVNTAVHYNPVVVGETIKKKNNFYNRMFNFRNKLKNKVIKHGRFYLGLGNLIESEVFVIRQEILEKVKFQRTDFGFEEYEYAINLQCNAVPVMYSSEVSVVKKANETFKSLAARDYQKKYKSFITFKNNFKLLFSKNALGVKELIISLLYPSNTVFVLCNILLLVTVKVYPNVSFSHLINFNYLLYLLVSKFVIDAYSMVTIRCGFNDYKNVSQLFVFAPVLYIKSLILGFFGNIYSKTFKKKENKTKAAVLNFEKHLVDVTITNGKMELPGILEIIKTNEYSQVVFVFKNKKLTSTKQQRINYAVQEIISKLKAHGFAIKICQNCGYFYMTESTAAHTVGEQGYCLLNNFKNSSKEKEFSSVWEGCFNIIPAQANTYVLQQLGLQERSPKV